MRKRWQIAVGALLLLLAAGVVACHDDNHSDHAPVPVPAAAAASQRWLAISDIHFNPFAGVTQKGFVDTLAASDPKRWGTIFGQLKQQPSGYGEDTNYALLQSTLASLKQSGANAQGVVISGDFLAHDFKGKYIASNPSKPDYDAFVDKTIAFLAAQFDAALPHAQFVVTLGNNDSYCLDYDSEPGSA